MQANFDFMKGPTMLTTDSEIFISVPDEPHEPILCPAKVVEVSKGTYTTELKEERSLEPGEESLIYYKIKGEFMQRMAQISAIRQTVSATLVLFKTLSDPVSAERRQCYRVSTLMADLKARIGSEEKCSLVDVSFTGFSIIAIQRYEIGKIVPVTLRYEDQEYEGRACVKSTKELSKGRIRYGLHGIEDKKTDNNLQVGMKHINLAMQRLQLRRQAGNGC